MHVKYELKYAGGSVCCTFAPHLQKVAVLIPPAMAWHSVCSISLPMLAGRGPKPNTDPVQGKQKGAWMRELQKHALAPLIFKYASH